MANSMHFKSTVTLTAGPSAETPVALTFTGPLNEERECSACRIYLSLADLDTLVEGLQKAKTSALSGDWRHPKIDP